MIDKKIMMRKTMIMAAMSAALLSGCASIAQSENAVSTAINTQSNVLTQESAEEFMPLWLGLLDSNAPVEQYAKYLPDGDFEQWSYTNAEIKDKDALFAYFKQNFAAIKSNENSIKTMTVTPAENGRFDIVADVDWKAVLANGQSLALPIRYNMTIGNGASSGDSEGKYPKVYKYKIRPIQ